MVVVEGTHLVLERNPTHQEEEAPKRLHLARWSPQGLEGPRTLRTASGSAFDPHRPGHEGTLLSDHGRVHPVSSSPHQLLEDLR